MNSYTNNNKNIFIPSLSAIIIPLRLKNELIYRLRKSAVWPDIFFVIFVFTFIQILIIYHKMIKNNINELVFIIYLLK